MNKLSILAIHVLLSLSMFSCNPYKRISGDQNRKPFERTILLNEAAREAPANLPTERIDTTVDDKNNAAYIKALEEGIKSVYDGYDQLNRVIDSLYGENSLLNDITVKLKRRADSTLREAKNAPPIIKTIEKTIERDNPAQAAKIKILIEGQDKLQRELAAKDLIIDKAKSEKEDAENKAKEAEAAMWKLFWIGLGVGAGVVAIGGFILKLKSII